MYCRIALVVTLSVPLWAQFNELAATDDGRQLYLSSPLVLRSVSAVARAESRIYRIDPAGVQLFAAAGEVGVQIPWEQRTGDAALRLNLPSDSFFQQNELAMVAPQAPAFEPLGPGESAVLGVKIVRGDFSGLQTTQPGPDDIVHLYLTGLGSVKGRVETGVPVPVGSVIPIDGDLRCRFLPQATDAETLFAGLAPGMIGIYQVSFRMPADAGNAPLNGMDCRLTGPWGSSGFGFWRISVP